MQNNSIPILYYHSVANHQINNVWSFLSIDIQTFTAQVKFLHYLGYKSCNWKELHDHINGLNRLPKKTVMFHFDDGFLDNWTVIYPIMKKYNFQYSVLITPEFVQKSNTIRPFVNKTLENNKELWWGYLSEGEIIKMSSSGLVDFQCHGYTHTWYESSDKLIGFYDGNQFLPHLKWNLNAGDKPFWLKKYNEMHVPLGYPIFEFKKSLELNKRFLPNTNFINECISCVKESGYDKEKLYAIYNNYKSRKLLGVYETYEESSERLKKELVKTREYIENLTNKDSSYIVFPGGGVNQEVKDFLKVNGFSLISKGDQLNKFNSKLFQVSRLAGFIDFKLGKYLNTVLNIPLIFCQLKRGHGNRFINKLTKLYKNV